MERCHQRKNEETISSAIFTMETFIVNNLERRIRKIEDFLGMSADDEVFEFPWPDGRVVRTTRRAFDDFVNWLQSRGNDGQKAIETDETERNRTV